MLPAPERRRYGRKGIGTARLLLVDHSADAHFAHMGAVSAPETLDGWNVIYSGFKELVLCGGFPRESRVCKAGDNERESRTLLMSEGFSRSWLTSDERNVSPAELWSFLLNSTQWHCASRLNFAPKVSALHINCASVM